MDNRNNSIRIAVVAALFSTMILSAACDAKAERMDEMWGDQNVQAQEGKQEGRKLLQDGNYAMFIHWGLYSNLANKYQGKTYYGIGEWIMNGNMAGIPAEEYKDLAKDFDPVEFDAEAIAKLAKDAGMRYMVITAKHHDGFAMYDSDACEFNIVDATPFDRDPLRELAKACDKYGLGLGFYYSHNQDWTFPGGSGGPSTTKDGKKVGVDYYYREKCLPQVKEITSNYGPIDIVWFDTPGSFPKKYVEELVAVVRENQPDALVSSRAGYGLGDYRTLGDMEVPDANVEGLWETVDTTNDSWAYAWYDMNWKSPKEILARLIACVGRGGIYMLNIGPKGDGSVPSQAQKSLRRAGRWIDIHPQVVYGTDASPWGHALPWGDITVDGNKMYLCIFAMPPDRRLCFQGLRTEIESASLLEGKQEARDLEWERNGDWTIIKLPASAGMNEMIPVVEVVLEDKPAVDACWGIDPSIETTLLAQFAEVQDARQQQKRWMEKFGEWKHTVHVDNWGKDGKAFWDVSVLEPGYYNISLTYSGEGRIVWGVDIEGSDHIQNEQNSSHNYQQFPIGWIHFPKPGKYTLSISCLEGNTKKASLKSAHLEPALLHKDQ